MPPDPIANEQVPWKTGDVHLTDDVYEALVPLDGYPKGSRGGPRPYTYGGRWWVVLGLSDFGDLLVGAWGPINQPTVEVADADHA